MAKISSIYKYKCPRCNRVFRFRGGLEWHLYHVEGWRDARKIIAEAKQQEKDGIIEMLEKIPEAMAKLELFAKGAGLTEKEALDLLIKFRQAGLIE